MSWDTRPVSRQKCQFLYSKQQEILGTPAGRPLFVPPGVPGTPGRCPENFFLSLGALFFPDFRKGQGVPAGVLARGFGDCGRLGRTSRDPLPHFPFSKIMESQTRTLLNVRFWNAKMEGASQPFANVVPTLCQPFMPTRLQAPLFNTFAEKLGCMYRFVPMVLGVDSLVIAIADFINGFAEA